MSQLKKRNDSCVGPVDLCQFVISNTTNLLTRKDLPLHSWPCMLTERQDRETDFTSHIVDFTSYNLYCYDDLQIWRSGIGPFPK